MTNIVNALVGAFKSDKKKHINNDIPGNIITAFLMKFPHAGSTTWRVEHGIYIASFGGKYETHYNANGFWLKTEKKIPLTRKLPMAISRSLKIGEFAAWYVKEIKKLEMRDQYLYVIHVDSGNLLDKGQNKFQMAALLYFNTDGQLLKIDKYKD